MLRNECLPARRSCLLLLFAQAQDQETVGIITFDGGMFDRAGKPNHLFKSAISNLELIVRDALATSAVAARPADAQQVAVDDHVNVERLDAGQIDLDDPAVLAAIHI